MKVLTSRLLSVAALGALAACQEPEQPKVPERPMITRPKGEVQRPGGSASCDDREGPDRALCLARRCFDKGARTYSQSLPALPGKRYQVGEWRVVEVKDGSTKVTLPIRAAGDRPHDATWEVSVGATVKVDALDADAAAISREHNACR